MLRFLIRVVQNRQKWAKNACFQQKTQINLIFSVKNSNKLDFFRKKLVYSKYLLYLCSEFEFYYFIIIIK